MRKSPNVTLALASLTLLSAAGLATGGATAQPTTLLGSVTSVPSHMVPAEDVSIRLGKRGRNRTWRGAIGDLVDVTYVSRGSTLTFKGRLEAYRKSGFITVSGSTPGKGQETRVIVIGDILSIESGDGGSAPVAPITTSDAPTTPDTKEDKPTDTTAVRPRPASEGNGRFPTDPGPGFEHLPKIFLLPIQGTVGEGTRHNEMKRIGEIADSYGPGQIIVLKVDSPGGLVLEADEIHATLSDLKLRHRLIAWVEEAISAAAYTSFHCNEVYFMKTGALGSATMFAGTKAAEGAQLEAWVKKFGDVAEESGHPRALAEAMITNSKLVSYDPGDGDKDPVVYDTLEGEVILSDSESNLTINASEAVDCGFAAGIASTEEELAELLRLPFWYETTDDGRRIHASWQKTLEDAKLDLRRQGMVAQGQIGMTGDLVKDLNKRLAAVNKLIGWARRLGRHTSMTMQVPPIEALEQIKKQLIEQIRQAKNN